MPYIDYRDREKIDKHGLSAVDNIGGLNYFITTKILNYMGAYPRYQDYNEMIGVLECIKLELYRRRIADYEDNAMERNGDVFDV